MNERTDPRIIQGGMGIGLSDWRLARAVARAGQLGTVSGSGLWMVLCRRLQDGDPGGHIRRALENFPFPTVAERILRRYYIEGGRARTRAYRATPMPTHPLTAALAALLVAASFVEVWLAKEGHDGLVAANYLEKIQLTHLPSLYGAMLAGVDYVIMGAGLPHQIPAALDALSEHRPATYRVSIVGDASDVVTEERFDPASLGAVGDRPALHRPRFLPVVSSPILAAMLLKRSRGRIDGFVVEGPSAGGHNAPPRARRRGAEGEAPSFGPEDIADPAAFAELGLPFWLAGSYGHPGSLERARSVGAHGIQAGSIFALCRDSALRADLRDRAIDAALRGDLEVRTSFTASPAGFPFKESVLEGTLSDEPVHAARERFCDVGALRTAYRTPEGTIGYRCAAEPTGAFVAKGGAAEVSAAAVCLCNALLSTVDLPQVRHRGRVVEPPLLTLGDDLGFLEELATPRNYSAADAIALLERA